MGEIIQGKMVSSKRGVRGRGEKRLNDNEKGGDGNGKWSGGGLQIQVGGIVCVCAGEGKCNIGEVAVKDNVNVLSLFSSSCLESHLLSASRTVIRVNALPWVSQCQFLHSIALGTY